MRNVRVRVQGNACPVCVFRLCQPTLIMQRYAERFMRIGVIVVDRNRSVETVYRLIQLALFLERNAKVAVP